MVGTEPVGCVGTSGRVQQTPHDFLGNFWIALGDGIVQERTSLSPVLLFVGPQSFGGRLGEQRFGLLLQTDKPAGGLIGGAEKTILGQLQNELQVCNGRDMFATGQRFFSFGDSSD